MFFIYLNLFKGMCVCVCVCVCMCICVYVCVCVDRSQEFFLLDLFPISSLLVLQGKRRVLVIRLIALTKDYLFPANYSKLVADSFFFTEDSLLVQK